MAGLNRVMLIGRLGNDPELKYLPNGTPVVKFSFATSESWTDRDGNRQEETEWHKIVVWNKQAENVAKFLKKGSQAHIEGKIKTESWDDKQTGKKAYQTTVVAQNVLFLESKPQQNQQPAQQQNSQQYNQPPHQQHSPQAQQVNLEEIPF